MTDALRDELLRVGETAPPAAVPGDLWARGRRARRRDRVVAGGAVLSVLLVLGGVGWVLGGPRDHAAPPTAPGAVEAVPSEIRGVPQRLLDNGGPTGSWRADVESTDLAVGRASVAFLSGEFQGGAVVVTAADGAYHLLELPGFIGSSIGASMLSGAPLELSPDGRQLAYSWWDPAAPFDGPMPSGVRVLDLERGSVRTIALKGRDGVLVGAIAWSPDSRWLVWQGRMQTNWTVENTGADGRSELAGRIAPGARVSQQLPVDRRVSRSLAVDSAGDVLMARGDGWQTWSAEGPERGFSRVRGGELTLPSDKSAGAIAADGVGVAFRGVEPGSTATFLAAGQRAAPGKETRVLVSRALPPERYPAGALVDPLGWLDRDHVIARIQPILEGGGGGYSFSIGDQELVVMSAPWAAKERFDVVAEVEAEYEEVGGLSEISVAVDLMTLDQPTRDFPAPEWPWSDERKVAVYGGGAVAVLAVLVFAVAYRRGRGLG